MPIKSPYPWMDLPEVNILSHIFPENQRPDEDPIWIDSKNPENSLSPAQALPWIKRLTFGLQRLGLKRGDVAMIHTPNHIFVPVAYLGIVAGGFVFSGANPGYTVSEVVHQLKNTGAKCILVHPKLVETTLKAARIAGVPESRIFQFSDSEAAPAQHGGVPDWRAMIGTEADAATYRWPELTPAEARATVATINYSSGTTGLPKGVCVSHANIIANLEQTIVMRYAHKPYPVSRRPAERWVGFLPLYHAYGQLYVMLMSVRLRAPVYIMTEFRYDEFLAAIGRYRITSLQAAPPILVMLSKRPETARYDLSSLRDVLCGGAPLSRELQNECQKRFDVQINQGWGMTEVTCGALHVPGGVRDLSGSVGRLDPNCEAKLVDEEGKEVPAGQPGELCVRGPQNCLGYWRNEAATRELFDEEGYLRSGDIAVANEDGFFWIVDRKKELIKVNALQVAPAELEGVLLEHEHIADAACVGITVHGEEYPRAYVVPHEASRGKVTEEHIHQYMEERVAKHKRLAGGIVFIDEVPKLASGKIQRKTMREWSKRDAAEIEKQGKKPRPRL